MELPFTWVSIVLGGCVGLAILMMVRRNHLAVGYAIWWMTVACASMIVGIFPRLMDWAAERIGVHYPPMLLVSIAFAVVLIKMLSMEVHLSQHERNIRNLAQRIAILEYELQQVKRLSCEQTFPE